MCLQSLDHDWVKAAPWLGFLSSSVDMCFPSDRAVWHLGLAGSRVKPCIVHKQSLGKGLQLHADPLPAGIFFKLGARGPYGSQKRLTPVCFGMASWSSISLHGQRPSIIAATWIMKYNLSKVCLLLLSCFFCIIIPEQSVVTFACIKLDHANRAPSKCD